MPIPLKQVFGLGTAKTVVCHWWAQRMTAVVLIVLTIWVIVLAVSLSGENYDVARMVVSRPWNAAVLLLFIVMGYWHMILGVQTIIEDYIHVRWQGVVLQFLLRGFVAVAGLASILAVLQIIITS